MTYSALPYSRSLNPNPYLYLNTTLLTINKEQIMSLLKAKAIVNSENWFLK